MEVVCNSDTATLLSKSTKFVPVPLGARCHHKVLTGVEDFLRKLQWRSVRFNISSSSRFCKPTGRFPPSAAVPASVLARCNEIRTDVARLLKRCSCCFSEDNLSPTERAELERLTSFDSIVISPVDKGGGWLIVPRGSYEAEAYRQLTDERFYEPISSDLDIFVGQRLVRILSVLHHKGFISRKELSALQPPTSPRPRNFYLLPKAHKPEWKYTRMPPGRPIVSDVDSTTRACASFIEYFLAPLARRNKSFVRDSMHVISRVQYLTVEDSFLLVTLDVASLYTNIPTLEGVAAVEKAFQRFPDPRRPDRTLLTMLELLLRSNCFLFNGERFLQKHGTAMGSAFGSSYANIFLGDWEAKIFEHYEPPVWLRYIDDVFLIWPLSLPSLFSFRDFINTVAPTIKVDLSYDLYSIRFLDLTLRKADGYLLYEIGFKPTDTHVLLPPSSFHPKHIFSSILFGQAYRWATHSSSYDAFRNTKRTVQKAWRQQGYTRSAIRNAVRRVLTFTHQQPNTWTTGFFSCDCDVCSFACSTKIVSNDFNESFLIVHNLSCKTPGVIYLITCKTCNIRYVGQTARPLYKRISEHLRHIRTGYSTPVSCHFRATCASEDFSFTALEHCPATTKRLQKENLWIKRLQTLHPKGLNEQLNRMDRLHLVLPFSKCSQRVARLVRSSCPDVPACASFTRHSNLASIFSKRRQPS